MNLLLTIVIAGTASAETGWQPKDKITLVLSIAAVFISLVTLFLTVLRPAAIEVFLGDFLILRLTWDNYVFVAPEVGLYNAGAKVGTVFKISGMLTSLDVDRSVSLRWKEVWEVQNLAEPGETTKPWWRFASFPELIVIPKTETALRRLCLVTANQFKLLPGLYELKLDASSGKRRRDVFTIARQLRLTEKDIAWLDAHKPKTASETGLHLHLFYDFTAGQYVRPV